MKWKLVRKIWSFVLCRILVISILRPWEKSHRSLSFFMFPSSLLYSSLALVQDEIADFSFPSLEKVRWWFWSCSTNCSLLKKRFLETDALCFVDAWWQVKEKFWSLIYIFLLSIIQNSWLYFSFLLLCLLWKMHIFHHSKFSEAGLQLRLENKETTCCNLNIICGQHCNGIWAIILREKE